MGPWAVRKSLSVGIFPYVLKLLGSQASELQAVLISIWARIIAVDPSCKHDLLKPAAGVAKKPVPTRGPEKAKGVRSAFECLLCRDFLFLNILLVAVLLLLCARHGRQLVRRGAACPCRLCLDCLFGQQQVRTEEEKEKRAFASCFFELLRHISYHHHCLSSQHRAGQAMCLSAGLLNVCVSHISAIVRSARLRQWVCLALSKVGV